MSEADNDEVEEFEIVRFDETHLRQIWKQLLGDITRQSAAKQLGVGTVSGLLAGWLFVKVGKMAAMSLGTSLLLIQVAQHQGYIQINWNRIQTQMNVAKSTARNAAHRHYPGFIKSCKEFVQKNMFLALGFGGGFFIGIAV